MTKKDIEEALLTEIISCSELIKDEDGVMVHKNPNQELGTYQEGLIYALDLLRK